MTSIFEFDDYRNYLKAAFETKKAQDPSFTQRRFARLCGSNSSSFLAMILERKRNISVNVADKIAEGLGLNGEETIFLRNLVLLNQATDLDKRQYHAKTILKSRGFRKTHPLAEAQFQYFTLWYYVVIRELVTLPDFCEDPSWIAESLFDMITPSQASQAIEQLIQLGIIWRNKNNRLQPVHEAVISPDEVTAPFAAQYHEQMIQLGKDSIRKFPREVREVSGLTFPISTKGLKKMKSFLQTMRKELIEVATQETDIKEIYQFNLQFFPLARAKNKK